MLRLSVLLLASLCGGCSVAFMTPPPSAPAPGLARPHVDCTTSYLAPILDSAVTAYQLAGVAYVATLDDARFARYPITRGQDMAVGAAFATAFAGSAIYGYVSAARCRRIQRGPATPDYLPGVSALEEQITIGESRIPGRPGFVPWRRRPAGRRDRRPAEGASEGLLSAPFGSEIAGRPHPRRGSEEIVET